MLAYVVNFFLSIFAGMWIGPGASTMQDLVLPRMRAVASAAYLLSVTFIGLALGPYVVGRLSDALGDLRWAMILGLLANGVAVIFLVAAMRSLPEAERTRVERAQAAS